MSKLNLLSKKEFGDLIENQPVSKSNFTDKLQKLIHSKYVEDDNYLQLNSPQVEQSIELNPVEESRPSSFIIEAKTESSINLAQQNNSQILMPMINDKDISTPYKVVIPIKKLSSTSSKKSNSKKKKKNKNKYKHVPFQWSTYRFLLNYPRKHWVLTLTTNLLIVITSLLGAYLPMLMGQLLDSTTKNNDEELHKRLSYTFLEVMFALAILQSCRAVTNQIWQAKIYMDMRHDVLEQFLTYDLNFFRKYRSGEIISRLTNDLQSAKSAVSGNIVVFSRNLIMTISNIVILLVLSYRLTIVLIVIMPLFTLSTMVYSRLSKKFEKISQEQQANLTSCADEIVSGVVTVKSFCGEQIELQKYDKLLQMNLNLAYRKGVNEGFFQLTSTFFVQFGTFIVLWYGGKLVLQDHELSPGELASFIFYSVQLSNAQSMISEAYSKIISATGAFEGVLEMLKYQPLVKDSPDAQDNIQLTGQIEFKNVYFQYPGTNVTVLRNLSLNVKSGEYVAFVGMSGSGKSTLVQLIERFYDPQSGQILMDGTNIKDIALKSLRQQIGLVSQEPTLFEGTLKSNITYGVENWQQDDLEWAVKASGCSQFINDKYLFPNGFDTFVGERGFTLSGGQKQRIAIARSLIKKPKILIFDEATSALDAESEYQVQSAIDDLIQLNNGITIIVIAHRLSTIVNCNKICVLANGIAAEQGTHQQLLEQNGLYKSLVDRQMQGVFEQNQIDDSTEEKDE